MDAHPQRWLFGHEHDAFQGAGPRPGVPPVFWPPLFAAAEPPEAGGGREGSHAPSGGVEAARPNSARGAGGAQGGRFPGGARGNGYAAPAAPARADSLDSERASERASAHVADNAPLLPGAPLPRREDSASRVGAYLGDIDGHNGTIPEIATTAALAELQARIRDDAQAISQFVAETDEQWQHLRAMRKELEEVQAQVATMSAKRQQLALENEEEERKLVDARRLRSSLRKGLHDAQKRVDGAGHRSRAALRQLQKLLGQAQAFVAAEEEVANGPLPAPAGGDAAPSPSDADDNFSDRYSVAEEAGGPATTAGPVGQLLTWARSVLSVRFFMGLSEVSLTLSPGPRRRRKRVPRHRPARAPLYEILELDAPDAADGVAAGGVSDDALDGAVTPPGEAAASLALPPPPEPPVSHAAPPSPPHAAPPAPPPAEPRPAPRASMQLTPGSVQELSMRLAQRMQDGARAAGGGAGGSAGGAGGGAGGPTRQLPGGAGGGPGGGAGGTNRFARLVTIAGERQKTAPNPAHEFVPVRAAPPPPQQRGAQGGAGRGGAGRADSAAVSWPLTPLSPQNSAERL